MEVDVTIGAQGHSEIVVGDEHCTTRGEYKILSTPNMVSLLERAAIDALQPFLDETTTSVGTRVDVRHLGPSLRGARVRAEAVVRSTDGPKIEFEVDVYEGDKRVGTAHHERYVLDLARYMRRLAERASSHGAT